MDWLLSNAVELTGVLASIFIGYHVYFLSQRQRFSQHLAHREQIRARVGSLLNKIEAGENRKVEIINAKRYRADYPHKNKFTRHGHTYIAPELKALRFDGVEFIVSIQSLYVKPNGDLTLNSGRFPKADHNVWIVGVVPYEWIEHVDPEGDEMEYLPQFFAKFGKDRFPYRRMAYYVNSDTYQEGSDPKDWKWRQIDVT